MVSGTGIPGNTPGVSGDNASPGAPKQIQRDTSHEQDPNLWPRSYRDDFFNNDGALPKPRQRYDYGPGSGNADTQV